MKHEKQQKGRPEYGKHPMDVHIYKGVIGDSNATKSYV